MPLSLDADVLSLIFAFTDVSTICSLSRVNKTFHEIASTQQLWISVVRELSRRLLLGPPADDLGILSTMQLKAAVKRAVIGPLTWLPSSTTPPTLAQQMDLSIGGPPDVRPLDRVNFFCGGRYGALCAEQVVNGIPGHCIHLWDLCTGRKAWVWERPDYCVKDVVFEFDKGGSNAVVVITLNTLTMLFLQLDLKTGISHDLFDLRIRRHRPLLNRPWSRHPKILGDFFVSTLGQQDLLLVNWRMQQYIVFERKNSMASFGLCADYLLLSPASDGTLSTRDIHFYPIASFQTFWRPVLSFNTLSREEFLDSRIVLGILFTAVTVVGHPEPADSWGHVMDIAITPSVLHDTTVYDLAVNLVDHVSDPDSPDRFNPATWKTMKTMARYKLVLPPSGEPRLTLRSVARDPTWIASGAGWGISRSPAELFVHPVHGGARELGIPQAGKALHVEVSRAGVVLVCYPSSAVVYYFV